jgi:hypothetical protein
MKLAKLYCYQSDCPLQRWDLSLVGYRLEEGKEEQEKEKEKEEMEMEKEMEKETGPSLASPLQEQLEAELGFLRELEQAER